MAFGVKVELELHFYMLVHMNQELVYRSKFPFAHKNITVSCQVSLIVFLQDFWRLACPKYAIYVCDYPRQH